MKFTVRYMLTKSERKQHRKRRILTQYGTLEFESETDPIKDPGASRRLREGLDELVPGWSIGGYHVSEGRES